MDKSLMDLPRSSNAYEAGVDGFLDFAFSFSSFDGMILCPCKHCKNGPSETRDVVKEHLICDGFMRGYKRWLAHGELKFFKCATNTVFCLIEWLNGDDGIHGLLCDLYSRINDSDDVMEDQNEEPNTEAAKFFKFLGDSQQELYPGCKKFSKLSFLIRMLHIKCLGKWTDKSFTVMVNLLNDAFPEGTKLPKSWYEAKKLIKQLGMGYEKYDACPSDCMLYWGSDEWMTECKTFNEPRWIKENRGKKVPAKTLWHFPLKPRLQRLFLSSKTAASMRWHAENRPKDEKMRHPADTPAWQTFDYLYPNFAGDSRNIRLGLASDGFNPFRTMNVQHSTWPVILMPFNLPPWLCMKKPYFMLSLLIPGPSQPGNDMDVYLKPLISELKELWDVGVNTYDASTKKNFQLHAALLWTINDFPECYMGHRRFLPRNHPFRQDSDSFDGTKELRGPPPQLTGSMILEELNHCATIKFGKKVADNPELPSGWRKKSIFFDLPYWKDNLVRHNLDVMHIEKNVCDSILSTLLNLQGKSKDHLCARLDLQDMGIRPSLHPIEGQSNKSILPAASYTLGRKEKEIFFKVLKRVKVPDGYSSNISRCVKLKTLKISGLKSHDNHVLMQQLLPLALRRVLPRFVRLPLIRLCRYFKALCSKTLRSQDLMAKKISKRKRQQRPNSDATGQLERATSSRTSQCGERKKTKGAIHMPEIWSLPPGVKLSVTCNKFGQPIDDNRSKFSCFLGVLARKHTHCPINIRDWRRVPNSNKQDMLVQLEMPPGIEGWTLRSIGSKWKNWKADLKYDYFDPTLTHEESIKVRDERVCPSQWKELILYWLSDEGKKASIRGKESHKHNKGQHNTGRKSFAQIRRTLEIKLGTEPTRVQTYKECYHVETGEAKPWGQCKN